MNSLDESKSFCTCPPSGNQVDGLPLAPRNKDAAPASWPFFGRACMYETRGFLKEWMMLLVFLFVDAYFQYEGRTVNRQPGFRSGDTYRRTCFRQDFSVFQHLLSISVLSYCSAEWPASSHSIQLTFSCFFRNFNI